MSLFGRVLGLLAAIAMIAPVDTYAGFAGKPCQQAPERMSCCTRTTDAGAESTTCDCCCCQDEDGGTDESSTDSNSSPGGCKSGQCNCHVSLCCGQSMPFLAPAFETGEQIILLVNKMAIPSLDACGDACLRGVFHPPRC